MSTRGGPGRYELPSEETRIIPSMPIISRSNPKKERLYPLSPSHQVPLPGQESWNEAGRVNPSCGLKGATAAGGEPKAHPQERLYDVELGFKVKKLLHRKTTRLKKKEAGSLLPISQTEMLTFIPSGTCATTTIAGWICPRVISLKRMSRPDHRSGFIIGPFLRDHRCKIVERIWP